MYEKTTCVQNEAKERHAEKNMTIFQVEACLSKILINMNGQSAAK